MTDELNDADLNPLHQERRSALIKRLKRVEGQLRGIQAMMQRESDCEAVVQQLTAARRALDKVFYETLACALQQDLDTDDALSAGAQVKLDKITTLLTKYG
ncbi:metal-sensing transcriptional repressor [Abyssibacter sp.]|jgi:DNA-binding FrmR family transcriptional regulator|uniref:metal-sensing transcriptional repressor n=1 Tax=Abyssibacter sp. TaxID=2320200 RepID=UPI0025BDD669|nr:metal-sensing transcriptional repressor [Abyssibacter sp.]MCK5859801.1 metal-sensing transcriptional repressor [Abyssibacter sp.]